MANIRFLKVAKLEFDDAIKYYEEQSEGLGERFKNEIRSSMDMIILYPNLYPFYLDDIRKCVAHPFPYTIFYTYDEATIYVYAVASHYRDPSVYIERFDKPFKD